jgi:hypothetical protein
MVTTAELNRRGLPYAVVVDGAATTASLQALDRQGLPYLVEVADGATMASRRALEARGLRYLVPVLVDATAASKASLAAQGLRYAVQVDADILPADRLALQRQGLACYVEVDSSGNSVSVAAVGGAALLANETDGFATDFTHPVDAERVALKASSALTSYPLDGFYQNAGTSPKMVYDVAGTLGWSPHNMFLNSAAPVTQTVTTVVGQNYTVTIVGSGSMTGSSGASGVATAGVPLTYTATGTSSIFTKAGTVTQIQMNRGAVATAYIATTAAIKNGLAIDYHPVTHAALGLLCEPAATNLQKATAILMDPTVWGTPTAATVTSGGTAPTGQPAFILTEDTSTASHTMTCINGQQAGTTIGTVYTISFHVKANGRTRFRCFTFAFNNYLVFFDLTTGTTDNPSGGTAPSARITSVGNGWYRCEVTDQATATSVRPQIDLASTGTTVSYTGNGTSGLYMWNLFQTEAGTVATSPIPTFAATVTRANDAYSCPSASINYSATAGSWWCENYMLGSAGGRILSASGGAVGFIWHNGVGTYQLQDGTSLGKSTLTALIGNIHKAASAYQSGDRAITVDGQAAATDAGSTTLLLAPGTTLLFGAGVSGVGSITGYIRKVRYVPRRKTNAEMQTETT